MRSWLSDESLTSPTETEVGTRFDLSNPHEPSHDLYHVLAKILNLQIVLFYLLKSVRFQIYILALIYNMQSSAQAFF